jgi:hypothetical protein
VLQLEEDPVPRRRGRTIGTIIIGSCVLLLFAHALFGERFRWHPHGIPVVKAEISPAERAISVGADVFTSDGALIGSVSGLSRDAQGHVERIRVTETTQTGSGRSILIIGNTDFLFVEGAVRLNLSVAELGATPKAMTEDKASD